MTFFKKLAAGIAAATLASLAFATAPASAADKVLVSAPPLHSLVSSLLEGVDTPGLIYASEEQVRSKAVDFSQLARIEAAELVIWVGPEYEQALATFLGLDRSIALKGMTLSKTIPMHAIPDPVVQDRPTDQHDMRFWLDPKLTMMAIHQITPALVKIYPDQYERILDNEIALHHRVMKLDAEMRKALNSQPGVPLHYAQSDVLYLARRFNLKLAHCPQAARRSEGFLDTPGKEHYFSMMQELVGDLKACRSRVASAG